MPKVSVIIPSFNHALFLKQRLQSILDQTYTDWEAIIIDDKSIDNSVDIITNFIEENPDFKVKYFIVNEINSGSGYNSWRKGLELVETEYVWIAETDDYSDVYFLEESVKVLDENCSLPLVFCTSNYVDQECNYLYDSRKRTSLLNILNDSFGIVSNDIVINSFPFNPLITNGSSVVFRSPQIAIPDEIFNYRQMSDLFFWTWLIQKNDIIFLNKKLNNFRRHPESTTTKIGFSKIELLFDEYVDYLNLYPDSSKIDVFFERYIIQVWWLKFKKGKISLTHIINLKDFNFLSIRTKFIKHLFRFIFSKFNL